MRPPRRLIAAAASAALLAGCGGSSSRSQPPPAKLEYLHGTTNVVLTPLGAERIGVQTAPVAALPRRSAQGALSVVPYSAVLYLLNGTPVVYTSPSRLTYTRVPVAIDHISGNQVYIKSGPRPGSAVVIVGGEELLGVQEGVEQQS